MSEQDKSCYFRLDNVMSGLFMLFQVR